MGLCTSSFSSSQSFTSPDPRSSSSSASILTGLSSSNSSTMNLFELPYTLFTDIITRIPPTDAISARRVSTQAHQALTRHDLCITLITTHFPRSREGRLLRSHIANGNKDILDSTEWAKVLSQVTRRYRQLATATPRRRIKIEPWKDRERIRAVTPWNRFLRLDNKTAKLDYMEPSWSFDAKEGLLVYPAPDGLGYQARDVETGEQVAVPFDMTGRTVRRARLSCGILILEWCESKIHHTPEEQENASRHFATAFDVKRRGKSHDVLSTGRKTSLSLWNIRFRSEWRIHHVGLGCRQPVVEDDRFYSTHNATHYAVYIWQAPKSGWDLEEPMERLIVWEIGEPSSYRPSLDPAEKFYNWEAGDGPRVIRKLLHHELEHCNIRQKKTPSFRALYIDDCTWDGHTDSPCGHVYFHEEEHRWSAGPHSNPNPPRLHTVKSTAIPLSGEGPRWEDDCGDRDPSMSSCWRGPQRGQEGLGQLEESWSGRAPCWRHDDFPYLTVCETYDPLAGVRFTARHCFMLEALSVSVKPKLRVAGVYLGLATEKAGEGPEGDEVQFADEWWPHLLGKSYIVGDERWLVGEDQLLNINVVLF